MYRGLKPVNWCFDCGSALAEAEIEYEDRTDTAVDVGFAFAPAERGRLDALIVTGPQLEAIEAATPDDEPVQELRLLSPTPVGYVIARSVIIDRSDVESARRRLAPVSCAQQQAPG